MQFLNTICKRVDEKDEDRVNGMSKRSDSRWITRTKAEDEQSPKFLENFKAKEAVVAPRRWQKKVLL